jgi:hypothetical protein
MPAGAGRWRRPPAGSRTGAALSSGCRAVVARHALAGDADQAEPVRQQIAGGEVIERRDDQPVRRGRRSRRK